MPRHAKRFITAQTLSLSFFITALTACGGGGGSSSSTPASSSSSSSSAATSTSSAASSSSSSAASSSSSTATSSSSAATSSVTSSAASSLNPLATAPIGWASTSTGTTGGQGADAAHTYTVTNRTELVNALYTGVTMAANGTFTGTLDNTPKIINIVGTVSLSTNKAGTELTGDDYLVAGACTYTSASTLFTDYIAAYAPNVWNTTLVSGKPNAVSGAQETARLCGSAQQTKVVMIKVGSNTTIQSKNGTGKITHGNLVLEAPSENIVIRNLQFEDAFDFFPQWTTTDSFPTVSATADSSGCSTTTPTKCVGGRWNSNYDLISVSGAKRVWIDHNTMSDGTNIDKLYPPIASWDFGGNPQTPEQKVQHHDGLLDITKDSNLVTVSYNHFRDHDKTGLIGGTDTATTTSENPLVLKVTFHGNYYQNNKQRQPRVRWGQVHAFNNYYAGQLAKSDGTGPDYPWSVAYTVGTAGKLWVENNAFDVTASSDGLVTPNASRLIGISSSTSNATKCQTTSGMTWAAADCNTLFYDKGNILNGSALADFDLYNAIQTLVAASTSNAAIAKTDTQWNPATSYTYTAKAATAVKADVQGNAGAGKITLP